MSNYYVAYEDKGPSGPCGLSIRTTAPWRKLYVFNNEKEARDFIQMIVGCSGTYYRKVPRIIGFWSNDPNYDNVEIIKK